MINTWLTEIRVKKAIKEIVEHLNDKFLGTQPDIEQWNNEVQKFLNKYYNNDVQVFDSILWRYTIRYEEIDSLTKNIDLVKLPWLI
jgi:hypothetical protein